METSKNDNAINCIMDKKLTIKGRDKKQMKTISLFFIILCSTLLPSCFVVTSNPHPYWNRHSDNSQYMDSDKQRKGETEHKKAERRHKEDKRDRK